MRLCALVLVVMILLGRTVGAVVVVNEVMSNEPGSESSLEWIELYNPGGSANFSFYQLRVYSSTGSAVVPLSGTLGAGGYLLLASDSVRFEEHFGDSSGTWGDAAGESGTLREASFQLVNTSGRVALTSVLTTSVSEIAWTEAGLDGVSWERVYHTLIDIGQSADPSGSTPGRINSLTPLGIDLALESAEVMAESGRATIAFRIVNRGLADVSGGVLELYKFDGSQADSLGDPVANESIGLVDSGLAVLLIGQYQFERYYQRLVGRVTLANDDRPANNRLIFTAPGSDYPPVILSEFMPAPQPDSAGEWIELKNVSDTTIDLASWRFGDATGLSTISLSELLIHSGEYLVLAEDSAAFNRAYSAFAGIQHRPAAWRALNNGSDSVRLVDAFGIQADRFYYETIYDSNYTWARSESPEYEGEWGRSDDRGGTPGEANRVRLTPEGTRTLAIEVEPRIIAPDGNGMDDSALIRVEASEADGYTIRLYDSQGRLVRTLQEDVPDLKEYYVWRGENDAGQKVPIGIYILYVEAVGVESAKTTIVVAR